MTTQEAVARAIADTMAGSWFEPPAAEDLADEAAAAIKEIREQIEMIEGPEQADNEWWRGWIAYKKAVMQVLNDD